MSAVASYRLPARLDLSSAKNLVEALRGHQGAPLTLDASDVSHLGTPGLQVLLAARRTWVSDAVPLTYAQVPPTFEEQVMRFGLDLSALTHCAEADAPPPLPGDHDPPSMGILPPEPTDDD